jgi:uncharacterized protein (DUF2252 family)
LGDPGILHGWTSRAEAAAAGRALRKTTSRGDLAVRGYRDRDALEIVTDQHHDRIPDLVPLRIARLLQSPFFFLRGTAAIMAHDLSTEPRTGVGVTLCGDAHLSNFGLFASPERNLLFDINDFDETLTGPWEWDLKRLAASAVVGACDNGCSRVQGAAAAAAAARAYRTTMLEMAELTALQRFYARVDAGRLTEFASEDARPVLMHTMAKARRHDSDHLLRKVTVLSCDGTLQFVDDPPILVRVSYPEALEAIYPAVRTTLRADVALLLQQFHVVDTAHRVVGVGSVGTRCYLALLQGPSEEPLFLQLKEAVASVLSTYGGLASWPVSADHPQGRRVVRGQRILQAASDPFLGWVSVDHHDYYVRQFRDMKGSFNLALLSPSQFELYCELCGRALARAHAQHPNGGVIAAYVGRSSRLEEVITAWAVGYAEQVERDHAALQAAVRRGRVPVAV